MGLGLIAAGTNNSRISSLIKNLGFYYEDDGSEYSFVIRLALGLVYSGKGILTLNQIHTNGLLINKQGLAGLLIISLLMTNMEEFIIKE